MITPENDGREPEETKASETSPVPTRSDVTRMRARVGDFTFIGDLVNDSLGRRKRVPRRFRQKGWHDPRFWA